MKAKVHKVDDKAQPRTYLEKIGKTEWNLVEAKLDVHKDVILWPKNPRLQTYLPVSGMFADDTDLEAALRSSSGYETLRRSIEDVGQMEPVYVWKRADQKKYIVFEGATRVAILRELDRKHSKKGGGSEYKSVRAKVLPPEFSDADRTILLARIHVRGNGVRSWGRYVEAKFIHDAIVTEAQFSAQDMALHLERSLSWVTRLRDAFEFAKKFEEHIDEGSEGSAFTGKVFSTLEEISKASNVGPKLRDYDNRDHDALRSDVYDMVRAEVFSEYRDARFLGQLYEDPEKWAALKQGGKDSAKDLVAEIKARTGSLKGRLAGIEAQLQRALDRSSESFDEEDAGALRRAAIMIEEKLDPTMRLFRADLRRFTKQVSESSLADVKSVEDEELEALDEALDDFKQRHAKATKAKAVA
jgi:hypothetical protein